MPDNANDLAPEQGNTEQSETNEQSASPSVQTALTREQLEEALSGVVEKFSKQYDGLRQVVDKRVGRLERDRQQAMLNQVQPQSYSQDQEQIGYNIGTEKDRRLARVAVREAFPDFDFEQVNQRLNDAELAPQYLALEQDGRTFDWATMYESAWKDIRAEKADDVMRAQEEQEREAAAKREQQKAHAVISGSSASYPEGVKIPQTRQEAKKLTDAELAQALVAQYDIPDHEMPAFIKENLKR